MSTKKVVEINLGNFGSTGAIMQGIAQEAEKSGISVYMAYPGGEKNLAKKDKDLIICSSTYKKIVRLLAEYSGLNGCFSVLATLRFLCKLNKIKPDLIHFHNLHDSYINIVLLFRYIKRHNIPVIWTLHDCWSFTGHCPHFTMVNCNKWKSGCQHCEQLDLYPTSRIDFSRALWKLKKNLFANTKNMIIVTPSQWLAKLVKQSFLKKYPVKVINNGIDLDVFRPVESNFKALHQLKNKFFLLGVAFDWGKRKGVDVFVELAKRLDDRFVIVLVGTNDEIDKILPDRIISIHRTSNQEELAEIYSSADLFVNPTREENYPTVNMESIACGTPVLTFRTGGSPEIPDDKSGYVVDVDDIDEIEKQIVRICTEKVFSKEDCLERAKSFDKKIKFSEYVELYNS